MFSSCRCILRRTLKSPYRKGSPGDFQFPSPAKFFPMESIIELAARSVVARSTQREKTPTACLDMA